MKIFKTIIVGSLLGLAVFAFAQQASLVTKDATNRNVNEARLVGELSFGGAIPFGQAFFEYGRTDLYGRSTPQRSVTEPGEFSEKVTGLNEDSGYHFRAVLVAADGELLFGEDKTFVTKRTESETPPIDGGADPENPNGSDTDGDGVPDLDECPSLATDPLACPDTDNDGIPDYQDPDSSPEGTTRTNENTNEGGSEEEGVNVREIGGGGSLIPPTAPTTGEFTGSGFDDKESKGVVRCGNTPGDECGFDDVIETINRIISFFLYFAILIFVLLMTYAGFKYITAGGSSDATKDAKKLMRNGLVGIAIIAFAWLGINTALGLLTTPESETQQFLEQQ